MMKAIKKFGIVALVLTALTGMIPITAKAADDNGSVLQILTPTEGTEYRHVPGNWPRDFEVTITDAIGELNDGTYTVWWDNNGSGNFVAVSGLKADAKGTLIVPRKYVTAMTYNSQFYVENESGARSEVRHVTVQVDPPRTISATLDRGGVNYKEGETAKVTLDFSNTFEESSQPGYIFLVPLDEATSNLVEITSQSEGNHTTSVLVYPGFSMANSNARILLKDGYDGCLLNFGIELRDSNDNTQDNIIAEWEGKPFTIGVDNVMPQITYIEMNGTPVRENGYTFMGAVPAGVQKTFAVGISDPGIEMFGVQGFDFADGDKAYTQLTFKENGVVVETKIIPGLPTGQTVTHRFTTPGPAQVVAKVRDKDMTDQEFSDAPEFTVNITVVDPPAIILTPHSGSTIFDETDTGPSAGRIDVELTVPPSGLDVGESITVVLEVSRNGLDDGPLPVLSRYEIPFKNGQTTGNFYLSELDGTPQSALKGFRINAYVRETTVCPIDMTRTWRQYYQPVTDFDIFVGAMPPSISGDSEATVSGDPANGFVVRPSDGTTAVEVVIPQGVDAAKVTVEVSPLVASVKANGAKMKVVSDNADITDFLDIPPAVDGIVDLARASVKAAIVEEVLDTEKGAVIELDPSNPVLTTVNTRKGLVYQLREGVTLDTMHDGVSILGNGQPWTPPITVRGGRSAFYSIRVVK